MVRKIQIPSYGEDILQIKSGMAILQMLIGVSFIPIGIVIPKGKEEILGNFFRLFFIFIGLLICIYTGYETRVLVKDYDTTTETYYLESYTCKRKGGNYYLQGISNGVEYSFNITGVNDHTIEILNGDIFGVKVSAYPNSGLVTTFSVVKDLKTYAECIPLETLKHCHIKPIDEEYGVNTLTLLAEDKEQDVALYGVQKKDRYGALVRVGDTVWYSSLFWNENNNQYLPEIRYKDVDLDGENEVLIQCFYDAEFEERNMNLFVKRGELYVCDYINDEWTYHSFLSQDYYDGVDDRIELWFTQEGHLGLELDKEEIDGVDVPTEERNDYLYKGSFYKTGATCFDLDKMSLIVKPFHYYKEMIDFVDIEFRVKYNDGKFTLLEGNVVSEK